MPIFITSLSPFETDIVTLVDELDREIGTCEKLTAHKEALLHRAFSIFIFRYSAQGLETLLQKRADGKYHSAGLWTNAVCSHPHHGENIHKAADRRLYQELGFETPLTYVASFVYKVQLSEGMNEHEYDHVFYGVVKHDQMIPFNLDEVSAVKWCLIDDLRQDLQVNEHHYSAWLSQALSIVMVKESIIKKEFIS